jgi:cell division protein FtsL
MSSPDPDPERFEFANAGSHWRGWLLIAVLLWLASLLATWYLASRRAAPTLGAVSGELADSGKQLRAQDAVVKDLRQQVATLTRSDQISRNANTELQSTLSEREEEVSGLRADVDFYERLVGSTGQRQGLRVHEAKFAAESGGTWHYTVTLTQNLNRGAISKGVMRFSVEGVRAGKLSTIKWDELLNHANALDSRHSAHTSSPWTSNPATSTSTARSTSPPRRPAKWPH